MMGLSCNDLNNVVHMCVTVLLVCHDRNGENRFKVVPALCEVFMGTLCGVDHGEMLVIQRMREMESFKTFCRFSHAPCCCALRQTVFSGNRFGFAGTEQGRAR